MAEPIHKPFRIGVIQMAMSADPADNLARALDWVRRAAAEGAAVICLPELFRSYYFCQEENVANFDLAEPVPGPSTEAVGAVAKELGVTVIASLFERRTAGIYHNTVATLGPDGEIAGIYRKMHIPDDPAYYEKFYFTPGDLGFQTVATPDGRIASLICWDQWYPEAARMVALRGAETLFYPTAIGWDPAETADDKKAMREAWITVMRGHAIANGVYLAAANRIGHEDPAGGPGLTFWGGSFICDPQGVVLDEALLDEEMVLVAEVDPARVEQVRRNWPFLRDRRIDAYEGLTQRFLDPK